MTAASTEERPIAVWMQMLEQIEEAVERRLAQVEEPRGRKPTPGRRQRRRYRSLASDWPRCTRGWIAPNATPPKPMRRC